MCGNVLVKSRDFRREASERRRDCVELDLLNLGFGVNVR